MTLTYYGIEILRPVFAGRNYKFIHEKKFKKFTVRGSKLGELSKDPTFFKRQHCLYPKITITGFYNKMG